MDEVKTVLAVRPILPRDPLEAWDAAVSLLRLSR